MPSDKTHPPAGKSRRMDYKEMRRKRRQQQRLVTVLIIVGAALLLMALIAAPTIQSALTPVGEVKTITIKPRPQAQANAMGDPNAPVKIEEFSDFQCPLCKRFSDETEQQIIETYVATGKVYFVYRSMGEWIGPESKDSAEAAYCAGEQNKFWEYHDILFANWEGENVGAFRVKRLMAFGESIGLDMGAFRSCMNGNAMLDRINRDRVDGERYGVQGTPSFVVNGVLAIPGAQPFSDFQKVIEAELAKVGQ